MQFAACSAGFQTGSGRGGASPGSPAGIAIAWADAISRRTRTALRGRNRSRAATGKPNGGRRPCSTSRAEAIRRERRSVACRSLSEHKPTHSLCRQFALLAAPMLSFTRSEIEAGRRLFAAEWDFAAAAGTLERLPRMAGIEVAFAGRSNVGKSSLINALTSRKALARTSHTPGRTQELIYFAADSPLRLVDMPGYGYAEAPKAKVKAWTALIH